MRVSTERLVGRGFTDRTYGSIFSCWMMIMDLCRVRKGTRGAGSTPGVEGARCVTHATTRHLQPSEPEDRWEKIAPPPAAADSQTSPRRSPRRFFSEGTGARCLQKHFQPRAGGSLGEDCCAAGHCSQTSALRGDPREVSSRSDATSTAGLTAPRFACSLSAASP